MYINLDLKNDKELESITILLLNRLISDKKLYKLDNEGVVNLLFELKSELDRKLRDFEITSIIKGEDEKLIDMIMEKAEFILECELNNR